MSAVCIIPARGGSRRIPRKNIKLFHGKPIIAYSIETAKESGLFEKVYVSTEDEGIADISRKYGATIYHRQEDMAHDEIGTQEVVRACLQGLNYLHEREPDAGVPNYQYACCMYACAPLMTPMDLKLGYARMDGTAPYVYVDGYYYWGFVQSFLNQTPVENGLRQYLPSERWIDVNTPEDWEKAEAMYAALHPEVA